jgi:fatty acid synthase subunit beta
LNNLPSNLPLLLLLQRPSPEFASSPEKAEELPLESLDLRWELVSRLVGGKMPGGFNASAIRSYLTKTWGLGPLRSDGVLLLATTFEPPKRFASEVEAKSQLDNDVSNYAQRAGISLSWRNDIRWWLKQRHD